MPNHDTDHRDFDHGFGIFGKLLIVLHPSLRPTQPAKGALHNPALFAQDKALGILGTQHNFSNPAQGVHRLHSDASVPSSFWRHQSQSLDASWARWRRFDCPTSLLMGFPVVLPIPISRPVIGRGRILGTIVHPSSIVHVDRLPRWQVARQISPTTPLLDQIEDVVQHRPSAPTPDSRLPIPDSRLPIPDSRFPTPYSPLPTPIK